MTFSLYGQWLAAVELTNDCELIKEVDLLLVQLPKVNYDVLRVLMPFFNTVIQHESQNKMSPQALATVISPNLLWIEHMTGLDLRAIKNTNELGRLLIVHWYVSFTCI